MCPQLVNMGRSAQNDPIRVKFASNFASHLEPGCVRPRGKQSNVGKDAQASGFNSKGHPMLFDFLPLIFFLLFAGLSFWTPATPDDDDDDDPTPDETYTGTSGG
jgi:hypothetical protein